MTELIKNFSELGKDDVEIAGGKGASLGEMMQVGIPVPNGFVILSNAFEKFLEETDLGIEIDAILDTVEHEQISTVEGASEKIQSLILEAKIPRDIADEIQKFFENLSVKYVAVRSSATAEDSTSAAWAGQLESYLNTTEESLLENVKKCWASLFTPRAIFYRFEKDLHKQKISVAVVVQKMVESEKSGIAFSVHPVTQDRNQLIIEAGLGLGEAIVSGQITPDSYVVKKQPRRIIDENIQIQTKGLYRAKNGGNEWRDIPIVQGEKQVLSEKEVFELSEIILEIENNYGFPCDVEWAFEKGNFYITQSRPITTLQATIGFEFEKLFTRDTSLIVFETWYDAFTKGTTRLFGINPVNPPIINYMFDGLVDIYESKIAMSWFKERLLLWCNTNEKAFYDEMQRYEQGVLSLKEIYKKQQCDSAQELKKFIDDIKDLYVGFAVMFFISIDDRHKISILERARDIRDNDHFFEINDKVIRNSLCHIYPEISGFEKAVLTNEIDKLPENEVLERRLRNFVFAPGITVDAISFNTFQELHPEIDFVSQDPSTETSCDDIRGEIAQKGIVIGRVRKVLLKNQIEAIEEGEVVVAHMTTPDFSIALNKASAIITDEGGITCHAAIIARELKKPCITGTKIATQVLKDGDIVEVDADRGVIKILKS